jgi:uncharacterized protein (TIGR02996 family)
MTADNRNSVPVNTLAGGGGSVSEEDAFQDSLDAEPDNHTLRKVFADWLDEQDDPRGPGYRALGVQRKFAKSNHYSSWFGRESHTQDVTWGEEWKRLPDDWFYLIPGMSRDRTFPDQDESKYWRYSDTRRILEDAAALAFSKLPPERQAELLGQTVEVSA